METSLEAIERALELNHSKHQLVPYLRDKAKTIPVPYTQGTMNFSIAIEILAYMLFYKRTIVNVLVGLLFNRFKDLSLILEVLDSLITNDLLDCSEDNQLITKFILDPKEYEQLSKMMYPLPMVVKPQYLTRNSHSGYIYQNKSCVVLRSHFAPYDVNLDHLNRVNSIPLRMNQEVTTNRVNKPKSPLPTVQDRQNFNRFTRQQRELAEFYADNTFYLTHKYDKRGRVYCQGYHISYQSTDFTNACIEFADGELVV